MRFKFSKTVFSGILMGLALFAQGQGWISNEIATSIEGLAAAIGGYGIKKAIEKGSGEK